MGRLFDSDLPDTDNTVPFKNTTHVTSHHRRSQNFFQISDMLLHSQSKVPQKRLEAKFLTFAPCKN